MILSMTGYGKSVRTYGEKKINVEIKSLNSKNLDLSTRIAPLYREKEMEIRQLVAQQLERGKIDFAIWIEKDAAIDASAINGALVENYYQQIKQIAQQSHIPEPTDWFGTLLSLPDVTAKTENEQLEREEWAAAELLHRLAHTLPCGVHRASAPTTHLLQPPFRPTVRARPAALTWEPQ